MKNLFSPLKLRNLELKNRIVVSPMQQFSAEDGFANEWHLVHYGSRAVGGAGLIITESVIVEPNGRSTKNDLGLWKDEQVENLKNITSFIHKNGAKAAIQLAHFGSKGSKSHPNEGFSPLTIENGGWQTVSSSTITPFSGMSIPKELTLDEIEIIQNKFVDASIRALKAGFDAIEIHAAHGYLFHQFYSELINQRTDNYGGSFENRIRFLVETAQKIRNVIPEQMPLLVRISAVDYVEEDKAWKIEDSVKLTSILKEIGVDMITASGGGFVWVDKSMVMEGYQVPFAEQIKNETGIVTGSVGGIVSASFANDLIVNNKTDLVVIAREFLRDPYFAINAARELKQEIEIPWQYKRAF
jgi:2,4-dienoyl-CoA reductase-like NADH-dependent reductase (Old Yellow Enzyme family)